MLLHGRPLFWVKRQHLVSLFGLAPMPWPALFLRPSQSRGSSQGIESIEGLSRLVSPTSSERLLLAEYVQPIIEINIDNADCITSLFEQSGSLSCVLPWSLVPDH